MSNDAKDETPTQPVTQDPLEVVRAHVLAAKNFGYREMSMQDILNMIDLAKAGQLGEFKPGF